jgi:CheY-like chemotaxis protein
MAIDKGPERPGLIVTEVALPELDGFSLVRALRGNPLTAKFAVLFVSAQIDPLSVAQAVALNCRYFVMKPFVIEDVVRKAQIAAGH